MPHPPGWVEGLVSPDLAHDDGFMEARRADLWVPDFGKLIRALTVTLPGLLAASGGGPLRSWQHGAPSPGRMTTMSSCQPASADFM